MPPAARVFFGLPRPRVAVRGVDIAGVVESVGRNVTRFKPGDAVFGVAPGAFAEYASTKAKSLAAKSPRLTFKQAAAQPVAGVTALPGLRDKAGVQPGQRVLVHGAGGGVGTFAVQIAKALGAHVTAVTGPRNLEVVRSLGPIGSSTTPGRTSRVWKNASTCSSTLPRHDQSVIASACFVPKGTFVGAGAPKGGLAKVIGHLLASLATSPFTSRRMVSLMARIRHDDLVSLQDLVEAGQITAAIDCEYALHEVPDAIRYVKSGQGRAKVVINISE